VLRALLVLLVVAPLEPEPPERAPLERALLEPEPLEPQVLVVELLEQELLELALLEPEQAVLVLRQNANLVHSISAQQKPLHASAKWVAPNVLLAKENLVALTAQHSKLLVLVHAILPTAVHNVLLTAVADISNLCSYPRTPRPLYS
jgi:hypothetical protein